jgi:hypothetical protein
MSWKKERDALIAQTVAFVQSVAGHKAEPAKDASREASGEPEKAAARVVAVKLQPAAQADPEPKPPAAAPALRPAASAAPSEPVKSVASQPVAPMPRPSVQSDVKSEIQARIASFRAHQERFNRERAEYFSATLARLRASIDELPPPREQVALEQEPVSRRSGPIPAADLLKTGLLKTGLLEPRPGSRSPENGRGHS